MNHQSVTCSRVALIGKCLVGVSICQSKSEGRYYDQTCSHYNLPVLKDHLSNLTTDCSTGHNNCFKRPPCMASWPCMGEDRHAPGIG